MINPAALLLLLLGLVNFVSAQLPCGAMGGCGLDQFCDAGSGICVPRLVLGEFCAIDFECMPGLECDRNRCRPTWNTLNRMLDSRAGQLYTAAVVGGTLILCLIVGGVIISLLMRRRQAPKAHNAVFQSNTYPTHTV